MKAIVYTEYGPPEVLQFKDVPKPAPKDNEILVRVHATTVNFGDLMARNFKGVRPSEFTMPGPLWLFARLFSGWNRPKNTILGSEFSGEVEAVGTAVSRFKPGDPVFGYLGQAMGADAEYLCMPADGTVALKPANMTHEEAAAVPYGAIMGLALLKKADVQPGQKVLINGASGGIGSIALQLAKHYGAEVTGVCSTPRLATVKALGADKVIDYTKEDFTQNGETYDLIFDVMGKASFSRCKDSLKENGRILYVSFKMKQLFQMLWTSMRSGRKVICSLASESPAALDEARELVEAGKLKVVIDRCYPLELAAEAHRYAEGGKKTGSIILTV
jgi:NADPH:quinone reductase-like Zn-dependent oxidoreductase